MEAGPIGDGAGAGVYVLSCGALARELQTAVAANGLLSITIEYLPARLHNTPDRIPALVDERLAKATGYGRRFVAYGDCGTGGMLDAVLERHGVERLPGAHCYEFFAGSELFAALHDAEPGTFYLTDYLTRHFERLVWQGLGIDRHPQLLVAYFGNYRRLLYLSQTDDAELVSQARAAADRLGLAFEHRHVGLGDLEPALVALVRPGEVA